MKTSNRLKLIKKAVQKVQPQQIDKELNKILSNEYITVSNKNDNVKALKF